MTRVIYKLAALGAMVFGAASASDIGLWNLAMPLGRSVVAVDGSSTAVTTEERIATLEQRRQLLVKERDRVTTRLGKLSELKKEKEQRLADVEQYLGSNGHEDDNSERVELERMKRRLEQDIRDLVAMCTRAEEELADVNKEIAAVDKNLKILRMYRQTKTIMQRVGQIDRQIEQIDRQIRALQETKKELEGTKRELQELLKNLLKNAGNPEKLLEENAIERILGHRNEGEQDRAQGQEPKPKKVMPDREPSAVAPEAASESSKPAVDAKPAERPDRQKESEQPAAGERSGRATSAEPALHFASYPAEPMPVLSSHAGAPAPMPTPVPEPATEEHVQTAEVQSAGDAQPAADQPEEATQQQIPLAGHQDQPAQVRTENAGKKPHVASQPSRKQEGNLPKRSRKPIFAQY